MHYGTSQLRTALQELCTTAQALQCAENTAVADSCLPYNFPRRETGALRSRRAAFLFSPRSRPPIFLNCQIISLSADYSCSVCPLQAHALPSSRTLHASPPPPLACSRLPLLSQATPPHARPRARTSLSHERHPMERGRASGRTTAIDWRGHAPQPSSRSR